METKRVNELDLLRFFAAMTVVLFHYSFRGYAADAMSVMPYPLLAPFAKYGYLGVELFFIISGFVILMTASNGSLRSFVVSRFVRLYPAFWAACTMTFVVTLAIGGVRYSATIEQYLVNMTMLSGFVDVPPIDGVYWTLFVELRFYALIALLLIIGKIQHAQLIILLWLIGSIFLNIHPMYGLNILLIVDYSAYFIAGAAYYLIWSAGASFTRVGIIMVCWGFALFQSIGNLRFFEKTYNTNMSDYVVASIVSVFFFVMFLISLKWTGRVARYRWVLAGSLTYPLYLLHENIGFMVFNLAYPVVNSHVLLLSTLFVVLLIAYAVHILIEKRYAGKIKCAVNHVIDTTSRLIFAKSNGH
ncbi:acyltransferase family protein [Undibacterium sp. SXout20W]|uniref:acyltransferase family protein n=1 Tax=Undibacterium sp. SXout20W TaxID=3413051 RepID=UPI003BF1AA99